MDPWFACPGCGNEKFWLQAVDVGTPGVWSVVCPNPGCDWSEPMTLAQVWPEAVGADRPMHIGPVRSSA